MILKTIELHKSMISRLWNNICKGDNLHLDLHFKIKVRASIQKDELSHMDVSPNIEYEWINDHDNDTA